ncbi:putative mediator of RNA polymerase II transcription subunit [Podospora didyma]|uniref:Mediator of RNA polymerase II transcription subunit 10 n=1 Tax=Podospora didyma TaxID=330526 RepID=A0AAE0N2Z5_9PEZI|nr:putative mediator of RNA polymerase II transcription subunit [Podospora didyma]
MAPVNTDHQVLLEKINRILADIFQILAQIQNYDQGGRPSREALVHDLQTLDASLLAVYTTASATLDTSARIPDELIRYVENGRNPDIYTREFVELVRRLNQTSRGKSNAFRSFRDVLAHEMEVAMPELRDDIRRVINETGGPTPAAPQTGHAGVMTGPAGAPEQESR